jgi:hypothetical protein
VRFVVYDGETRSVSDLTKTGSHVYFCDPVTDVNCVSYCIGVDGARGPINTWLPSQPVPAEILEAATDPDTLIVAFNDAFDRQLEKHILHPRYGWPIFPLERRRCAQATVLMHALPAGLDSVAAALQLPVRKTKAGNRAVKLLASPRKPRKGEDPSKIYWHDDPELLATLYEYNRIDVEITAEIVARFGFIPAPEQKVWQLDAAINARGICCDVELLDAAISIAEQSSADLCDRLAMLTNGEITSAAQAARIKKRLAAQGCEVPNVQENTLLEALQRANLTPAVKQLIDLRLNGAHAAVNKLNTLRRWLGPDRRIRYAYRYHGAMPGRFTSMGVQLQNLKKPAIDDVAGAIEAVRAGSLAHMQAHYERPLSVVGDITRALIVPAPGHRLFIADLSGIESRGLAWIANQQDKLEAWRKFDCTGERENEPYYSFALAELGLNKFDPDALRRLGKLCDLAFGYQGSLGAWRRLAPADDKTADAEVYRFRQAWLRRHPNIEKFWATSVRQATKAIENPDQRFTVARIAFIREGQFLYMELPSGRRLSYPFARIYEDEHGKTFTFRDASGGRWEWYHVLKHRGAFGGLSAENATQAICRDIFVEAMQRLEAAGYHIVAHLHDEFVCEVPEDFGDLDKFRSIITTPPSWAPDFPIATKARIAQRFIESKAPNGAGAPPRGNGGGNGAAAASPDGLDDELEIPPAVIAAAANIKAQSAKVSASVGAQQMPPNDEMPPPEFDDPPPRARGNGHDPTYHAVNGGDGFEHKHTSDGFDSYSAGEQPRGEAATHYVYKDAHGRLYMRVTRTCGKSSPTQHWHDGRWVSGWPATAIPYRLPELLGAPASEPVWICEGEKDADNVAALGLIATTNPGGASKWQPELAQYFKDKSLAYVVEDNDDAGRAHTNKILSALAGIVPTIAVIAFPELAEKADVSDWLENGGNKKLLLARAEQAQKRSAAQEIIEPVNLWGQFDPPPLPSGLLPDALERFAHEEGDLTGADPSGFAVAALVVCGAALPDHTQLQVKRHDPNWLEEARFWAALVGNPSTKKSPIILRVTKAIRLLDAALWHTFMAEQEIYKNLSSEEREKHEPPKQKRLLLGDTTVEAAQEVLKDSPDGVLCIKDELAGWFGAMDKYSGRGAAADRAFWLQAYDGRSYVVNRIKRGPFVIPNLSVSLLGGIQPDPARRVSDDTVDDGLLQRLIPVILAPAQADKDTPTGNAGRRYDALIGELHERSRPRAPLQLNDAALEIRQDLVRKHIELMKCEAINRKLAAHLGKYDGIFARLCLLWHCIEQPAEDLIVTEHTARRVADFLQRFLLPHAMAFYAGTLALSDDHDRLTQIAGYILAKKLTRITNRDVQHGINAFRGLERQNIESVFDQLEALGWLMRMPGSQWSKPPHWLVNPEVHRRFTERAAREATERAKQREMLQEMFKGGSS